MVRPDKITEIDDELSLLWLVIKCDNETLTFEFESDSARIVTVGSAAHSDVRLDVPGAAPLVCYFERDGEKIWLVPGYRCKHLRVDTTLVERPRRLGWRNIVEFSGITLEVRVREEPPTSPENGLPVYYSNGKGHSLEHETGRVISGESVSFGDNLEEFEEDFPTKPSVPTSQRSARMVHREGMAAALEPESPFTEVAGSASEGVVCRPIVSVGESRSSDAAIPLERQVVYGRLDTALVPKTGLYVEMEPGYEPLSMSPSVISLRALRKPASQPLAVLGELTRRRPILVAVGASCGSVVLFLILSAVVRTRPSTNAFGRDMPEVRAASATQAPVSSYGQVPSPKRNDCLDSPSDRCVVPAKEPKSSR